MMKSAVDRVEQGRLVELFTALQTAIPQDDRLAEPVTFWRYQLLIGVEPSQLPELLDVLDRVTATAMVDTSLQDHARHWRAVLGDRLSLSG
jgi:hypothetical protein